MKVLKFCENCNSSGKNLEEILNCVPDSFLDYSRGYVIADKEIGICPYCAGQLLDKGLTLEDYTTLGIVSNYNREFVEAMIELKKENIIEFESKMAQFRVQEHQLNQNRLKSSQPSTPHCPSCGSTNLRKISAVSKAGSVALWGIFSQKVKKQFHCENCGYEW